MSLYDIMNGGPDDEQEKKMGVAPTETEAVTVPQKPEGSDQAQARVQAVGAYYPPQQEKKKEFKYTGGWWQTPQLVSEIDKLSGQAEARMEKEKKRAKMQRDMAILGDLAKLGAQIGANAGGAWKTEAFTPQTQIANERLAKLRDEHAAQVEAWAKAKMQAREAEAKDQNTRVKYELSMENAELERQRKEDERAEKNAYYKAKLEEDKRHNKALEEVQKQNAETRAVNAKGVMQFRAYDKAGNEHYFKTKNAAEWFAIQEGTYEGNPVEEVAVVNGVDRFGNPVTTTTTRTSVKGGSSQKPGEKKGSADFSQYKRGNTDFSKYKRQ